MDGLPYDIKKEIYEKYNPMSSVAREQERENALQKYFKNHDFAKFDKLINPNK